MIFSILAVCLFAAVKFAVQNWRAIEDRVAVQTQVRKIETRLCEELRKSSFESVVIYEDDYRHTIAFRSYINPETGLIDTDSQGALLPHGFILYTLLRTKDDPCAYAPLNSRDSICPHKMLIRVELTKTTDGTSSWDPLEITDSSQLQSYIPSPLQKQFSNRGVTVEDYVDSISTAGGDGKYVRNVSAAGKDILTFDITKVEPPSNPEVLVDISCYKILEGGGRDKVGSDDLEESPFTVRVLSRVIPLNP